MSEAHLLSLPPVSGSMNEVRFDAVGTCTWVRFVDDEYNEWCGVFGRGFIRDIETIVNLDGHCFVLSCGQGFLIDIHSRALLHKTAYAWLVSVISIPETDIFLACDYTNVIAYSPAGIVWKSERVSVDGIRLIEVSKATVKGQVWNMEDWVDFLLDG
jgi:hypothetical protein